MKFFLLIVGLLIVAGVYFFVPFDEVTENLRLRSQEIVNRAKGPLPKIEDIKEIPSSFKTMFEEELAVETTEDTTALPEEGEGATENSEEIEEGFERIEEGITEEAVVEEIPTTGVSDALDTKDAQVTEDQQEQTDNTATIVRNPQPQETSQEDTTGIIGGE